MDRIDKIIQNEKFRKLLADIAELEKDRIFCHHDMDHFLDVARIASLMAEDEKIDADREIIYAASILHDIGRGEQYRNGTPHEAASALIAPEILKQCDFSEDEISVITEAIQEHGNEDVSGDRDLNGLIYRADKASRKCYMCKAADKCHKAPQKRVMNIRY